MEPEGRHVGVERARPVARSAVDENAVKPAEPAQVLAADFQVEKAVKDTHALDVVVVEDDFAGPRGRAVRRAAVPAELIGDSPVERPGAGRSSIALQLRPDARAEAYVVAVARLAESKRAEAAVRVARNMVHYLLTNAKVRARVEAESRIVGFLNNGFRSSRCRNCSFRSSGFRVCGFSCRNAGSEKRERGRQEDIRKSPCHKTPFLRLSGILYQIPPHGGHAC